MTTALQTATYKAQQAYRLLMTRGTKNPALAHCGEGYRWQEQDGLTVILRPNGAYDASATKAANTKPAAPAVSRAGGLAMLATLATLAAGPALAGAPDWSANKSEKAVAAMATQKECGRRWQAGKEGRIAAGETWQAFAKECREQVRPSADECVKAGWPATDMCRQLATGRAE